MDWAVLKAVWGVGTAKYTTYAIEQKVVTCGDVPLTALFAVLMFFMFMFTLISHQHFHTQTVL